MNVNAVKAAQAYAQALQSVSGAPKTPAASTPAPAGASFADMVKDAVGDSMSTLKASEAASAGAVTGDANLVDVVTAVSAAEVTLQTVVTVRDKMVQAYQEILRMPI